MYDEQAKIKLRDGREVWRKISVRYRDVKTGTYLAAAEVDALLQPPARPRQADKFPLLDRQHLEEKILAVHSEVATDPEAGRRSVDAARLVLGTLKSIEAKEDPAGEAWFVLGRELAKQVLALLEDAPPGDELPPGLED